MAPPRESPATREHPEPAGPASKRPAQRADDRRTSCRASTEGRAGEQNLRALPSLQARPPNFPKHRRDPNGEGGWGNHAVREGGTVYRRAEVERGAETVMSQGGHGKPPRDIAPSAFGGGLPPLLYSSARWRAHRLVECRRYKSVVDARAAGREQHSSPGGPLRWPGPGTGATACPRIGQIERRTSPRSNARRWRPSDHRRGSRRRPGGRRLPRHALPLAQATGLPPGRARCRGPRPRRPVAPPGAAGAHRSGHIGQGDE